MKNKISLILCLVLTQVQLFAQQAELLSSGRLILSSDTLYAIRDISGATRLRTTAFADTVRNAHLIRGASGSLSLRPDVRIVASQLVLTFMHNGKLPATLAVPYDSIRLSVFVRYKKALDSPEQTERVALRITHSEQAGVRTYARDAWFMPDVLWARIEVDTFQVYPTSVTTEQLRNNVCMFSAELLGENYVVAPSGATPPRAPASLGVQLSENGGYANLWWNQLEWADSYDLEWTFVDNSGVTTPEVPFNFRNNASRVNLKESSYQVPIVHGEGILIFRVRANGRRRNGSSLNGPWSHPESGNIATRHSTRTLGNRLYVDAGITHENGRKNWQYTAAFAENGLRKDMVSYHDGALKKRQVVAQLNGGGKHLIVAETYYDHHGRPVVQSMPAPFKPAAGAEPRPPALVPPTGGSTLSVLPHLDSPPVLAGGGKPKSKRNRRQDPFAAVASPTLPGVSTSGASAGGGIVTLPSWALAQLGGSLTNTYAGLLPPPSALTPGYWTDIYRYFEHRPALRYQPAFNVNVAGQPYSARDFAPGNAPAAPFGTQSGAGNYYSPSCPTGVPYRHLIPDAEGFAFSQTVYTPDLTGRVAKQSGLGADYRIGSGHESQSAYSTPTQFELDRLFGNDVGDARFYKKQIVTDANGQMATQYIDPNGVIIAIGALGSSPDNLDRIDLEASETLSQQAELTRDNSRLSPDGRQKTAMRTVVIAQDRSNLTLDYRLTPAQVRTPICTGTICDNAVYDVRIRVFDQSGRRLFDHSRQVGTLDAVQQCVTATGYTKDTVLQVNRGSYTIEKTMTLNATNEERYVIAGLQNARACIEPTVRTEIEATPCVPDGCVQCEYEMVGRFHFVRKPNNPPNCSRECTFGAPNGVFNRLAYEALLRDMMPGGQYAELYYGTDAGARHLDVGRFPLSVFNTTSSRRLSLAYSDRPAAGLDNTYRMPAIPYRNADGSLAEIDVSEKFREPGFCIPDSVRFRGGRYYCSPAGILDLEFLQSYWQESWSESLVAYHPEYPFYLAQVLLLKESLLHDTAMLRSDYSTALSQGWIQPGGGNVTEATLRNDPFFATTGTGSRYASEMLDSLNRLGVGTRRWNVHQALRLMVHCNSPYYTTDDARLNSCVGMGASDDLTTEQQNLYWQTYRSIYLAAKADFIDRELTRTLPRMALVNGCMDLESQTCPGCIDATLRPLFEQKQRRFQRSSCFKSGNLPSIDSDGNGSIDAAIRPRTLANYYRDFLAVKCSVDTIAHSWLQFFNGLLVTDKFFVSDGLIPSMPPMVVSAAMIARFPDRLTSPQFRWNATLNADNRSVQIRITHPSTGAEQARFTLRADTPVEWRNINQFSCISCQENRLRLVANTDDAHFTIQLTDAVNLNLPTNCIQATADARKALTKDKNECCRPLFPVMPEPIPCQDGQLRMERMNESYEIAHRLSIMRDSLIRSYRKQAMRATEAFTVSWSEPIYHFTLFYSDAAGNLIKTVPPKAVIPLTSTTAVAAHRTGTGGAVWPSHNDGRTDTLCTEFRYNGLGNKISRNTPDGGLTRYYYDEVGRAIASVNAEQASRNALSYVLYDEQGRSVESGALSLAPATLLNETVPGAGQLMYDRLATAVATTPRNTYEVYKTTYDKDTGVRRNVREKFAEGAQKRLRGRVARQAFYQRGDQTDYTNASHLSYDIAGNVQEFVHDYAALGTLVPGADAHAIKQMRYRYDLLTGRVTESVYQTGQADQFYHWYQYDAEGRIIAVQTAQHRFEATDVREKEVKYHYYLHGPVARAEIGHDHLQGIDLAYTLRGQLKQMNSVSSTIEADMGNDGRGLFATDAVAFSLQYFPGDYKPIGRTAGGYGSSLPFGTDAPAQYGGNIAAIITRNEGLDHGTEKVLATAYRYDQLNRLRSSRTYRAGSVLSAPSANTTNGLLDAARDLSWTALGTQWATNVEYDKNGNMTQLLRYGANGSLIDQMQYSYVAGTNKLERINDRTGQALTAGAAIDMPRDNVYGYDALGRLIQERSGGTADLHWSMTDKLLSYTKDGRQTLFSYDAFGRRTLKQELGTGGVTTLTVRDLQGNILSTYELGTVGTRWKEVPIYAAGRLASWQPDTLLTPLSRTATGAWRIGQWRGTKAYELTQHTGEVLATISDRKLPVRVGREATWSSDYLMAQEYYPFGMPMPERTRTGGRSYRFGFQGMERDDNLRGNGNSYTTEFRQYDPRVGRWLSLDPVMDKYAGLSPYNAFMNNPVSKTDPNGDDTEMNAEQFMQEYNNTERTVRAEGVQESDIARVTATRLQNTYGNITIRLDESATSEALSSIETVLGAVSTSIGHAENAIEAYDFINGINFRAGAEAAFARQAQGMIERIRVRVTSEMRNRRARSVRREIARQVDALNARLARGTGDALDRIIDASAHSRTLRGLELADRYILIFSVLSDLVQGDLEGLLQTGVEQVIDLTSTTATDAFITSRVGVRLGLAARTGEAATAVRTLAGLRFALRAGILTDIGVHMAFPETAGDGVCTWVPNLGTVERTSENCRAFIQERAHIYEALRSEAIRQATHSPEAARRMTMSGGN